MNHQDIRPLNPEDIEAVSGGPGISIVPTKDIPTSTGPTFPGDPTSPQDPYHTQYN